MTIAVIIFAAVLAMMVALFAGGVVLGRVIESCRCDCSDEDERED